MNRLLAGPPLTEGAESLASHTSRLGLLPDVGPNFIHTLVQSRIAGRGGAGFAAGTKWSAVATHSRGNAVVVVNGAEGEPQSKKDRLLMSTRPHLILDGAFIAARVLRARRVVLYIGERHTAARSAMLHALAERAASERSVVSTHTAPARYVAGAEVAAIHLINDGVATPITMPPYPFERGVDGMPTLVQNVETLAQIALIARHGTPSGTSLVTMAGAVARTGVLEVHSETTVGEAVKLAGGTAGPSRAVLIGGYFGKWVDAMEAWDLPLDAAALRNRGLSLGCGVIGVLATDRCPVCEVSGIMRYLASESSAQCGPCFFGLRALADACGRIATNGTSRDDLERLNRWANQVRARGACRHPDGAVMFLESAMKTFSNEFAVHMPHIATLAT
jgi:NADH:ubiquinone oxidoreductase subunit F (NADH-binding)